MKLNKEIQEILMEYGMLCQENNWNVSKMEFRSTYDTFRIQNIIELLTTPIVVAGDFYCNDEKHYPNIGRCANECDMCKDEKNKIRHLLKKGLEK